jgi:uncharacterized membrane protein YraQ (UPF0718 family)
MVVTYSLLGPMMAIYRPVVAFVTGVLGGAVTALLDRGATPETASNTASCSCCANESKRSWRTGFHHGFVTLPRDIGKPLLIGLAIAAALSEALPENFLADTLGTGIGAMLIMMAVGIPLYVCATASVPVAAALILQGITPGAALVFLITGPATNAAGLAVLWKTLGRRTAIVYLVTVAVCALAAGLLFDAWVAPLAPTLGPACHEHTPAWWQHLCAILLLALMGRALLGPKKTTS